MATSVAYQRLKSLLLYCVTRHDEERGHLEAFELWPQAIGVIEAVDVDGLLRAGYDVDRDIVVATVLKHHQASMDLLEKKIQRQVAIRHGCNRIDGVGVAAAHEIAKLLVHRVHGAAVVVLGG